MLVIKETFVNETRGHMIGESEWYEPFTDSRKRLFRECQRDYGRCVSAMYVALADGSGKPVGWVFQRRMEYEDSGRYGRKPEFYIREVWVELREADGDAA